MMNFCPPIPLRHSLTPGARPAWLAGPELQALRHPSVIAALVAARACRDRGITVLGEREADPVESASYGEILVRSEELARRLLGLGVRRGDPVILALPTGLDFVYSFFALQLLGAVPVPTSTPHGLRVETACERLRHTAENAAARLILADSWVAEHLREGSTLPVHSVAELRASAAPARELCLPDPAEIGFVQYTSGSTSRPKGVELSHHNLASNVQAIGQAAGVSAEDVCVSWCPLHHDMGLIGTLLFSVYWNIPLVLLSPRAFLRRPARWLRAISEYRGSLSPAPDFAYRFCRTRVRAAECEGLDLGSWRVAFNGAEPVWPETLDGFREHFAAVGFRAEAMCPVYGLAECSLAVTAPDPARPAPVQVFDRCALSEGRAMTLAPNQEGDRGVALVSVGRPVAGHELCVVDADRRLLDEGRVGEIRVRGASVMRGYRQDPDASAAVLARGWLHTGDLGFVWQGHLFVTGRSKDLIIRQGRNYFAEDIERCAESVAGVEPGSCAVVSEVRDEGGEERVVLFCETRDHAASGAHALREAIRGQVVHDCDLALDEVRLLPPRGLPRTTSGKRQRQALLGLLGDQVRTPR